MAELTDEELITAALQERDGEEVQTDSEPEVEVEPEPTTDVTDTDVGDIEDEPEPETQVEGDGVEPDDSADPDTDDTPTEPAFKPVTIKARGMEIEIKSQKELMDLAHKGFDYFKKTQELSTWRKQIGLIESAGLSDAELQRFADAKKGDKLAIASIAKAYGVDTLDIEDNDSELYTPQTQMGTTEQYEIEDISREIQSNPEHAERFSRVAGSVPNDFAELVAGNSAMLRSFNEHVATGLAERIIPEATKAQMQYGGSFMDHYSRIGEAMAGQAPEPTPQQQVESTKPQMTERERGLRQRAASPGRSKEKKFSAIETAEDIWDMDDKAFEAYASNQK